MTNEVMEPKNMILIWTTSAFAIGALYGLNPIGVAVSGFASLISIVYSLLSESIQSAQNAENMKSGGKK